VDCGTLWLSPSILSSREWAYSISSRQSHAERRSAGPCAGPSRIGLRLHHGGNMRCVPGGTVLRCLLGWRFVARCNKESDLDGQAAVLGV
jgi:hypothetical protein